MIAARDMGRWDGPPGETIYVPRVASLAGALVGGAMFAMLVSLAFPRELT